MTAQSLPHLAGAPPAAVASLAGLAAGQQATIARLALPGGVQERVMELGLVPGTTVTMVRAGRRHLVVALRGFVLGLGRPEAARIEVVGSSTVS